MCLGCVSLNAWFCIFQDGTAFTCLLSSSVTCQGLLVDLSCMSYVRHTMPHVSLCHQQRVNGRSLTNSVNSNGPNTDPWGTPLAPGSMEVVQNLQPFVFSQLECFNPCQQISTNTKCLNLISKSDVWYCIKCFSIVKEYYIHWYVVTQSF